MCGIFGAIGEYREDKLRLLSILNESRGKHSTGMFVKRLSDKNGYVLKDVETASDLIKTKDGQKILKKSTGVFIGHTRFATAGKITVDNCHPFRIGNILGAHNGIIYNHTEKNKIHKKDYAVDSQIAIHNLNLFGAKGLSYLEGYWGLAWYNFKKPNNLYLTRFNNELAVIKTKKAIYFSSDIEHLKSAGIKGKEIILEEKYVYRFDKELNIHKEDKYSPKEATFSAKDRAKTRGGISTTFDDLSWWDSFDIKENQEYCDCCGELYEFKDEDDYQEYYLCPTCKKEFEKDGCLV